MFIDNVIQICDRIMGQTTKPNPHNRPHSISTVLLVEDEPILLENFRYALEQAGYNVLTANSGESAVSICRKHTGSIDVLVSDIAMDQITGFEVAASVKWAHPNVIVILMSGSPISSFPHHAANDHFLQKPFPHQQLLTAISRHTGTISKEAVREV